MSVPVLAAAAMAALLLAASPATAQPPAAAGAANAADQRYTGRDGAYRMRRPDLGAGVTLRDTMVNERTGWAEFASRDGAWLFVVSNRLVDGPRDERELEAVKRRYADFSRQLPAHFSERSGKGPFGPTWGFTLLNADPVTGYPVNLGYRPSTEVNAAAVHRFFVRHGVLYEVAVVVQRRGPAAGMDAAQLASRAGAMLDTALAGFEPVQVVRPNATERP
jgi:hypothetical protein